MAAKDDNIPRIITRELPNGVTYDLTSRSHVTITLPRGSTWSSGLHWHESHVEYLQVVQGSIRVRLHDVESIVSASPGSKPEIEVARFAPHSWERASPHEGEDVIVVERTAPADGEKALFFWNLNGVILDAPRMLETSVISRFPTAALRGILLDFWVTLNLFVIFLHLDNFPVLVGFVNQVGGNRFLGKDSLLLADRVVTHIALYLASWVGWLLNARPLRLKYTPAKEYAEWTNKREKKKQG